MRVYSEDILVRMQFYLKKQSKTQKELTDYLGITKNSFTEWKAGRTKSYLKFLPQIAQFFKISVDELCGIKKESVTVVDEGKHIFMIPVFESVSAGFGAYPDGEIQSYMPMFVQSVGEAKETIMVRVEGDSMYPKIEDGSLVQVHRQTSVDSGQIAVVIVDGEDALVKKVEYGRDYIRLVSINPAYPERTFRGQDVLRVSVQGVVRGVFKAFD